MTKLKFKKLDEKAVLPSKAHVNDAGFDITAISIDNSNPNYISYGTGLAVEIPENHVGLLFPRSSVTKKDLILKNCVGVVDSGYRGELSFRFHCVTHADDGDFITKPEIYQVGDRIGQLIILELPDFQPEFVDELEDSSRGKGGYGSTGN